MAVQSMEVLSATPVGQKVYLDDRPFWRHSEVWWSIEEGGPAVVRDTHFVGYVGLGRVLTLDEQELTVGAMALGDHSWMFYLAPANPGYVRTLRFWQPGSTHVRAGQRAAFDYRDIYDGQSAEWFRKHRAEPEPDALRGMLISLVGAYQQVQTERDAARTETQIMTERCVDYESIRDALRRFLA